MSAIVRGRDGWVWLWLSIADVAGVPLVDLGEVRVVNLKTLHRERGS